MTAAEVYLWGTKIGAVVLPDGEEYSYFEYTKEFLKSGFNLSPVMMPLSEKVYHFTDLSAESFHGLPGLLSDSLPDAYGNAVIEAWLAAQGRSDKPLNAVERLCYTGSRGMGALEYQPAMGNGSNSVSTVKLDALVELASEILTNRNRLDAHFSPENNALDKDAMSQIISGGTSAGGARAKALIAINDETGEIRSGQVRAGKGYKYYLIKFDGITGNKDKEDEDGNGYSRIEFAYYLMAGEAGIMMSESRLLADGRRRHFLTKRFDRLDNGDKLHMQTLAGLAHFDYRLPDIYTYEQVFSVMRKLGLNYQEQLMMFRRMVFNVMAVNQDDHVKNISFLMDRRGTWSLAPAYDITFAYNPTGKWTSRHQLAVSGKRFGITAGNILQCADTVDIKRRDAKSILDEVYHAVSKWKTFAEAAGVNEENAEAIESVIRAAAKNAYPVSNI